MREGVRSIYKTLSAVSLLNLESFSVKVFIISKESMMVPPSFSSNVQFVTVRALNRSYDRTAAK